MARRVLFRHGPFAGQVVDLEEGPYIDSLLATGYALALRMPDPEPEPVKAEPEPEPEPAVVEVKPAAVVKKRRK